MGAGEAVTPEAIREAPGVFACRPCVRNQGPGTFDINDRVDYAAKRSFLRVDEARRLLARELNIDRGVSRVIQYFEI
jgi:hypothetical protein